MFITLNRITALIARYGMFKKTQGAICVFYNEFKVELEFVKSDNDLIYDHLIFRYKLNNERFIEASFAIDWQQRTYGKQPYFICNRTVQRVKHLLIVSGLLKTRHEFDKMCYYSEHESIQDRHARAARKIRRRFGKDNALLYPMNEMLKPKNIHRKLGINGIQKNVGIIKKLWKFI